MIDTKNFAPSEKEAVKDPHNNVEDLYQNWFIDYASYVILDRAIPSKIDGLKPVQRRLLHALEELDDGRFNKAANVIGHTMRYHPHGDAAIGDAMVKLAQKGLVMDCQGNWGNAKTGDRAAAPRYIETRLSEFAKEVIFNPKITPWQMSYDGRKKEPITLPVKFPLLLAQGAEGIAVGLATRILPHNFGELIKESIAVLKGYRPQLLPDFPTGGFANFSQYRDGRQGGKVWIRAVISVASSTTLRITEIPYGVTTSSLIESIVDAHEKGLLRIKRVEDNTAKDIDIIIHLHQGTDTDSVIKSLYAVTECQISISPSCCVIDHENNRPLFCSVSDLLDFSAKQTQHYLRQELELEREVLQKNINFLQLEQLFISHKIYRKIEEQDTWEKVILIIRKNLKPLVVGLNIELDDAILEKLTELKIKQISKFDQTKSSAQLEKLKESLKQTENHLAKITKFTISFYENLLRKYGKLYPRRTKIENFSDTHGQAVLPQKMLFYDEKTGTVAFDLQEAKEIFTCDVQTEIIAFRKNGSFKVVKLEKKAYVGEDVFFIERFERGDDQREYCLLYQDSPKGPSLAKRFTIPSPTKGKDYALFKASGLLIFLGYMKDQELIQVYPEQAVFNDCKLHIEFAGSNLLKESEVIVDFTSIPLKTRGQAGNPLSPFAIKKFGVPPVVTQGSTSRSSSASQTTPTSHRVWYDRSQQKFNTQGEGLYLGKIRQGDPIVFVLSTGKKTKAIFNLQMQIPANTVGVELF